MDGRPPGGHRPSRLAPRGVLLAVQVGARSSDRGLEPRCHLEFTSEVPLGSWKQTYRSLLGVQRVRKGSWCYTSRRHGLGDRVAAPQLFVGPRGQKLFSAGLGSATCTACRKATVAGLMEDLKWISIGWRWTRSRRPPGARRPSPGSSSGPMPAVRPRRLVACRASRRSGFSRTSQAKRTLQRRCLGVELRRLVTAKGAGPTAEG